jgi:hypothetical protein
MTPTGRGKPKSLASLVFEYIRDHGPCTVLQIRGAMGPYVSRTRAIHHAHTRLAARRRKSKRAADQTRYDLFYMADLGLCIMVSNAITSLRRHDKVVSEPDGTYQLPTVE